jgi:hypothetical protein
MDRQQYGGLLTEAVELQRFDPTDVEESADELWLGVRLC